MIYIVHACIHIKIRVRQENYLNYNSKSIICYDSFNSTDNKTHPHGECEKFLSAASGAFPQHAEATL